MFEPEGFPNHVTGDETRARLLAAATEVFLVDGYRAARVQDIARRADLRLSAINYHFGGKEGLYRAVLQHHADLAILHAPLHSCDEKSTAEQLLQIAVRSLVSRMLDDRIPSRIARFMFREMANPTPALEMLIEHFSLPQLNEIRTLVGEILGPKVPQPEVLRAIFSIMGQSAVYVMGAPLIERLHPNLLGEPDLIDKTSNHIAAFSWAGLMAMRNHWETHDGEHL